MSQENYIVSARKYRPATFQSVVGQRSLVTTLKNAIHGGKLAHAYLFCGPRGVGKTTCARIFAKTINCFRPTSEGEACNECESCVSFNEQRSFNIHELDAASNNSVDNIRELTEQVRIPPQVGRYKVYIVDEVHMLSTAAFNAFLKTLEEPPAHAIFILATTEKHKILPTILSRCQIYDFSRISVNDTVEHLQYVASQEGITAEPEALNVIAQKADGGMRDALSIFDQVVSFCGQKVTYRAVIDNLNVLDYDYYFRWVDLLNEVCIPQTLLLLDEILERGFDLSGVITGLASHLRDVMVSKDPVTLPLLEVADVVRQKYQLQAQQTSLPFLYKALEILNECDLSYKQSKNKRLLVELCLIRLAQLNAPSASLDSSGDQKKNIALEPFFPSSAPTAPATVTPAPPVQSSASQQPETVSTMVDDQESTPMDMLEQRPMTLTPTITVRKAEATVSIRMRRQVQPTETNSETGPKQTINNSPFTVEQLEEAWKEYAKVVAEEMLLRNTFLTCLPTEVEGNRFSVVVDAPLQQQQLFDIKPNILEFLAGKLQNNQIDFDVRLSEMEASQRFLTPHQRFTAMLERQPSLRSFKQQFGLEMA